MNVTLTGVDVRTDLAQLPDDCEIGVLYTETQDGRNRYPAWGDLLQILVGLAKKDRRVAIHVCGRMARNRLMAGELEAMSLLSRRFQVNGVVTPDTLEVICDRYPEHEIVTQYTAANVGLLAVTRKNHAVLVDASGGRGLSPASWVRPETTKPVGFAGGLGPDNIKRELSRIHAVAVDPWWIDMEGKLRDEDDWFDVGRAHAVMEAIHVR